MSGIRGIQRLLLMLSVVCSSVVTTTWVTAHASTPVAAIQAPLIIHDQTQALHVLFSPDAAPTGHRHIIFLPGICPRNKGANYAAFGCAAPTKSMNAAGRATGARMFGPLLQALQHAGVHYAPYYYSYPDAKNYQKLSRFNAQDTYLAADTHGSHSADANRLNAQVQEILTNRKSPNYDPQATFDLVGDGLGGVVAAYWVVAYATKSQLARVHSLITLDSPLQGYSGAIPSQAAVYQSGTIATDLVQRIRAVSIGQINNAHDGLLTKLPRVLTFANARDKVVPQRDAWIGTKIAPWNLTLSACRSEDVLCAQTVLKNGDVLAAGVAWIRQATATSINASSIHSKLALLPIVTAATLRSPHNNLFAHPSQPAYTPQQGFAPDFQRVLDLLALQVSLAQYVQAHHAYPSALAALFPQFAVIGNNGRALASPPGDPVSKQPYYYVTTSSGTDYRLTATLDNGSPYTVGPLSTQAPGTLVPTNVGATLSQSHGALSADPEPAAARAQFASMAGAPAVTVERSNGALPVEVQADVLNPAPASAQVEVASVESYWLTVQPGTTTGGASLRPTDWTQNAGGIWAKAGLLPPIDVTDPFFLTEMHGDPAVWNGVFSSSSVASASVNVSPDTTLAYNLDILTMICDVVPVAPKLSGSVEAAAKVGSDIFNLIQSLPNAASVFNDISARNFPQAAKDLVQLVNSNSGAIEQILVKLGIATPGGLVQQLSKVSEMVGILVGTSVLAGLANSYLLNLHGGTVTFTTKGSPPLNPAIGTFLLSPSSGPPGTTFTVHGNGWTPSSTVQIVWDGASAKNVTVGSDGTFQAQYQVPTDAAPGAHQVIVAVVCSGSCQGFGQPMNFVVQEPVTPTNPPTNTPVPPTLQVTIGASPTTVPVGQTTQLCVTVSKPASVALTATYNGVPTSPIGTPHINPGIPDCFTTTPFPTPGTLVVTAMGTADDGSGTASNQTTVTIQPGTAAVYTTSLTVSPSQAAVGGTVTFNGTGFIPGETVQVTISDPAPGCVSTVVASAQAGPALSPGGTATIAGSFTVPDDACTAISTSGGTKNAGVAVTISAVGTQSNAPAGGTVVIPPTIASVTLSPPPPAAPTAVGFTGSGFAANEQVSFVYGPANNTTTVTATADGNGNVTASGSLPTGGIYFVTVTGLRSGFSVAYGAPNSAPTVPIKPAGEWIGPMKYDSVTNPFLMGVTAHPTNSGDPAIQYVNFTVNYPPGSNNWKVACTVFAPNFTNLTNGYGCSVDMTQLFPGQLSSTCSAGAPPAQAVVSFDVYDQAGNINSAPNGEHPITISNLCAAGS